MYVAVDIKSCTIAKCLIKSKENHVYNSVAVSCSVESDLRLRLRLMFFSKHLLSLVKNAVKTIKRMDNVN